MANSNTFKMLKEVIYGLYDNNGNERPTYIGIIKDNKVSENRVVLLKNIIKICIESDMFSEDTKIYLKNRDLTLKRVNEVINERLEEERSQYMNKHGLSLNNNGKVKYNSTVSKIMYDQKKLNSKFGGDFMTNIVVQKTVDISNYELVVNKMLSECFGNQSVRDKLSLNIKDNIIIREYNGDFIDKYGEILRLYLKSTIMSVEEMLNNDKEFAGYFNYLLSGISTSEDKVIEDRRKLENLLNLDMSDLIIDRLKNNINVENVIIKEESKIEEEKEVKIDTSEEKEQTIKEEIKEEIVVDTTIKKDKDTEEISLDTLFGGNSGFDKSKMSFDKFNIVPQINKKEKEEIVIDEEEIEKDIEEDIVLEEIEDTDTLEELDFEDDEDDFIDLDSIEEVKEEPKNKVKVQLRENNRIEKDTKKDSKVKVENINKDKKSEDNKIVNDKDTMKLKTNRIQF